jgi:hypothetical protein
MVCCLRFAHSFFLLSKEREKERKKKRKTGRPGWLLHQELGRLLAAAFAAASSRQQPAALNFVF